MSGLRAATSAELELYLQALWGRRFRVSFAEAEPGVTRSAFDDCQQLLPALADSEASSAELQRARAAHAAAHAVFSGPRFDVGALKPLQQVLVSLFEDARVEALAVQRFPGLGRLWAPFHQAAEPTPFATCGALLARLSRALFDRQYLDPDPWIEKARRAFAATDPHDAGPQRSRRLGSLLGNDLGQMRLPFDARQYQVAPAYRDDHGGLWQRPPAPARAVAPTPSSSASAGPERRPGATSHFYPEWDYVIARERPAFCELRDEVAPSDVCGDTAPSALVERLRRQLRRALTEVSHERRCSDGPELDLAAAVDAAAARVARRSTVLRVYQRPRRRARRASVLLLLDLSESSNVLSSNGTRATELSGACARLLCATTLPGLELAIDGFCSYGRTEVRYTRFKDFTEPVATGGARLGKLTAAGSTRLGAAVRHACRRLSTRGAAEKLLLIVSDGEPADVDIYDERYLADDARRAIDDARRGGVAVHGCCLPGGAAPLQAHVFGRQRAPLARVDDLAACLTAALRTARRDPRRARRFESHTQSEGASWTR